MFVTELTMAGLGVIAMIIFIVTLLAFCLTGKNSPKRAFRRGCLVMSSIYLGLAIIANTIMVYDLVTDVLSWITGITNFFAELPRLMESCAVSLVII